jgi:hypothetical protein
VKLEDKVTEFAQSPFASFYLKHRYIMSCLHNGVEYEVGDFVELVNKPGYVYRIDNFVISPIPVEEITPDTCFPAERVQCTEFLSVEVFEKEYKVDFPRPLVGEIVEINDGYVMDTPASSIKKKIAVAYDANLEHQGENKEEIPSLLIARFVYCTQEAKYVPSKEMKPSFLPLPIQNGKIHVMKRLGACVVISDACVVISDACVIISDACVLLLGACAVLLDACVIISGACVVLSDACVIMLDACVVYGRTCDYIRRMCVLY